MKKLKIIVPVVLAIVIAACVACYVFFGNKVALTDRSKAEKGLSKALESFEEESEILADFEEYKYMKNIDSKSFETEVKFNVDANIDGLESIDKNIGKLVNTILDELSDADVTMKVGMDKKDKKLVYGLNVDAEKIIGKLTGEAVITEDEISFKSDEINKNFLTIKKADAKDNNMDEVVEAFDAIKEIFEKNFNDYKFTDEEIKHFKDTYSVVLENTVTDDMISSEDGKFKFESDEKDCTVTTVKLNNDKVKELLKNYVKAYKEDKEGKEILTNKVKLIYGEEFAKTMIEEIDEAVEEMEEAFDEIEGTSIDFITYGTITEVYGNEYKITIDEETLDIVEKFDSDNKKYVVSFEGEELLKATVTKAKGELNVDATMDLQGVSVDIKFAKTSNKVEFSAKAKNMFEFSAKADIDTKTNKDKEFAQDVVLTVNIDVPLANIKGDATIKMNEKLNIVDSIDVPDTSKAVSVFDNTKMNEYAKESQTAISKIGEKFMKSDLYKAVQNYSTSKYKTNTYNYNYNY